MQRSTLLISASPVIPLCSLHNVMLLQLMCDSLGFEVNSDLTHTDYSFSKWCTLLHVYTNRGNLKLLQWLWGIKVDNVLLPRCYAGWVVSISNLCLAGGVVVNSDLTL